MKADGSLFCNNCNQLGQRGFTLNGGHSVKVNIYRLATFPFGVVIMSVRVEAVEQIICIHICRLFEEMQICNVEIC